MAIQTYLGGGVNGCSKFPRPCRHYNLNFEVNLIHEGCPRHKGGQSCTEALGIVSAKHQTKVAPLKVKDMIVRPSSADHKAACV